MSKHLTDAECAAEYWRAEVDSTRDGDVLDAWANGKESVWHERASTWHRFAKLPNEGHHAQT